MKIQEALKQELIAFLREIATTPLDELKHEEMELREQANSLCHFIENPPVPDDRPPADVIRLPQEDNR